MPELPEVETVVRGIQPALTGRAIENVWLDWAPSLVMPDVQSFIARIRGQRIQAVTRRAKYIVIKLDADYLIIHLKMTGRLYVVPADTQYDADRWVHFRFGLGDGRELRFSDARKFGRVYLTADASEVLGKLGPEPLADDFTWADFAARLAKRKGTLKPLLLNQAFIAGIGNIYADEALHLAHIHPQRRSDTLRPEEITALYNAIREVLHKGIARQGASINWYRRPDGTRGAMQDDFFAYGRTGAPCRTCGQGTIEKIVVAQRSTHFCPRCQK
ncbi:MAG: bifunctional DNA-formamidopyrimidine glycosylase/DNA-(apurinic or apyrimidinic site) lyase [Anaerolineales bacterium]